MTIRNLPPDEWGRLEAIWPAETKTFPSPTTSLVVVAEEEEEIVGFWVAQLVCCLEPVWVAPKKRGGLVGKQLYTAIRRLLRGLGIQTAMTHARNAKIEDYLRRLGFRGTTWKAFYLENI